jgi:PAS domain S-box-containing protein
MSGGSKKILLVEDEAIIAMSTALNLRRCGYEVENVLDGESALARVAAAPGDIDLILMDVNLGRGLSGPETARAILKNREVPIVFLSSHSEKSIVESTEEIGSYGYVAKNSGTAILEASIKMAFRLFEARQSIHAKSMDIESANQELRLAVSELTAANKKLILSEEKFHKAFHLNPDSININRLSDGLYIDVNEGFTRMTGYTREEVLGRSSLPGDLGIWVRSEDRERLTRGLRENGEVADLEAEFRRKDGSTLVGMMSAKKIEIEGEECLISITRDITDRKRADDLIKDSESRFRAAFANGPVGMALLSVAGELRMMNKSFSSMLDYDREEAASLEFMSFLHPEDRAAYEEATQDLLRGGRETTRLILRFLRKGGRVAWVDESISLQRDEGGEPLGLIIHALDISERKLAEKSLAHLNRIQAVVGKATQLILRESDRQKMLEGACRIAVEEGRLRMAWIGMVDEKSDAVRPVASAGAVDGYLDVIEISLSDQPTGRGTTGIAARLGQISICADIEHDERMVWRAKALERGYRSSAGFPLRSGSKVIGVFSVYSDEIGYFGKEETDLLEQLALDISFELASIENEEKRREAEARLLESEGRYRASFMQSSAVKLLLDPETNRIVDANHAAADFYGYSIPELTAMEVTDLNPAPRDRVREDMALAREKRRNHFYFVHRLASGELRDVEVFSSPIEIGGRTFLHSIIHDITDQKQAELALKDSERRFRTVFELAPVGMSMTGADGRFIEVNKAFCEMLGRSAEELAATPYAGITHPEDLGRSEESMRSCLSGDTATARLVKRYLRKDGGIVWADVSIAVLRGEEGEPTAVITHNLDITEQTEAGRALAESEGRFKSFVENASDVIYTLDAQGRFTYVSPNWRAVLGHESGEVLGRSFRDFAHPDDAPRCEAYLEKVLAGDDRPGIIEFRVLNKAGEWRWHSSTGSRIVDERSAVATFIGISRDVTERRRSEERLERLVLEKETLMKELQHRVKNNLGVVTSLLNLEEEKCSDENARMALSNAVARVRSISAIYERLYLSEDLERVDLALYLEDLATSLFQTYNLDPERVVMRISADRILLDTKRTVPLGLILNELLSNALKYAYPSGKRGEVRVELSVEEGAVSLTVSDDGAGIPDEYLSPDCSSMGMTLVRMLARQLGGELRIDNAGGTRVRIRFAA